MPNNAPGQGSRFDDRTTDTIKVLRWIAAQFPHVTLAEENILAYAGELRHHSPIDLIAGARAVIHDRTTRFFPSVGELDTAAHKAAGSGRLEGHEAWGMVKKEMVRVGSRRAPELDPVTFAAIEAAGGWEAFGQSDIDDEPSWRAQFLKAYDIVAARYAARDARASVRLEISSGSGTLAALLKPTRALLIEARSASAEGA